MNQQNLIVEKNEYQWLLNVLENRRYTDPLNQSCLETLHKELKSAVIKEEYDMPGHVVRINSMVDVLTPYGIKNNIQIVVPAERNMEQDKISILSPMGSALFGYKKGDEVRWIFPKGKGKIKILEVKNAPIRAFK